MSATAQMTEQGLLLPHTMLQNWGEVEVIQRPTYIIIKPRRSDQPGEQLVQEMRAAGLIVDLPGPPPPIITTQERAALAQRLSQGRSLSEIVIEERADRV